MINYDKYTYTKIGSYTNVVYQREKDENPIEGDVGIHPLIEPVIRHAALHHADWTLVGYNLSDNGFGSGNYHARAFDVICDGEVLGIIKRDAFASSPKIDIFNKRIADERKRRGGAQTVDAKKAIKTMEKYFVPKTMGELVTQARLNIQNALNNMKWAADRKYEDTVNKLREPLLAYAVQNWGHAAPILAGLGASEELLASLPALIEHTKTVRDVCEDPTLNGYTVVLHKDRYLVSNFQDNEWQLVTGDQLSDDTRAKLGMLKLCEDKEAIADVGTRVDDKTFYILN